MDKVSNAVKFMNSGYSCSQAVMCAFCEYAGVTRDEAAKISAPYSGGRAIKCGAVYSSEMVLKAKYGNDTKLVDELDKKFIDKVGAINCRDIRGKRLIPCVGCVETSAKILDDIIKAH